MGHALSMLQRPSGFCTRAKLHGLPPPFSPFHLKQSAGSLKSGVRPSTSAKIIYNISILKVILVDLQTGKKVHCC